MLRTPGPTTASTLTPRFPLRLTDEEGVHHRLPDPLAVEQALEFWDDDEEYYCIDADGQRVRLIVWSLRLLVCQHVALDYSPQDLEIAAQQTGPERQRLVEVHLGRVLRALEVSPEGTAVEPPTWEDGKPSDALQGVSGPVRGERVRRFHNRWMTARLGGKFP